MAMFVALGSRFRLENVFLLPPALDPLCDPIVHNCKIVLAVS